MFISAAKIDNGDFNDAAHSFVAQEKNTHSCLHRSLTILFSFFVKNSIDIVHDVVTIS